MKRIIINRSNEYNEYVFEVTGYIPKELEEDLEEMTNVFVEKENPLLEEIEKEIKDFKEYHKKRNGIVIKYTMHVDSDENSGKIKRVIEVKWNIRRSFNRYFEESFSM